MYWKTTCAELAADSLSPIETAGRFVLHRHHDLNGPHLDLRIEQDGYLMGWRIDALSLDNEPWATLKPPHSTRWLDHDGDAIREDAGSYAWASRSDACMELLLFGRHDVRKVRFQQDPALPSRVVKSVLASLDEHDANPEDAARLIVDGLTARNRAIERLCGLGHELDGGAFRDELWRKTLRELSLAEIHAQLHAFEQRFDAKYPPQSVSIPEKLPEDDTPIRRDQAWSIANDF